MGNETKNLSDVNIRTQAGSVVNSSAGGSTNPPWVAIAALIVSICALVFTAYQGSETRLHNRLSVKPLLLIDFVYTDKGAGFLLTNDGLGPAVIGSFVVLVDDKPKRTWAEAEAALGLRPSNPFFRVPFPDTAWRVNDPERRIYWIDKSRESDLLKKQMQRVLISVCYCSIYGECWSRTNMVAPPKEMASCEKSKYQLINIPT